MPPILTLADLPSTDFLVGEDDFADIEINQAGAIDGFYYFRRQSSRVLIKDFILQKTPRTVKTCRVTLIKTSEEKFTPRLDFAIRDTSNKAIQSVTIPVTDGETRQIKAHVEFDDCHENFWALMNFLAEVHEIDLPGDAFRVFPKDQAALVDALENIDKPEALMAIAQKYGELDERDISLLTRRREQLAAFERLLNDAEHFASAKVALGSNKRDEDVWQDFFERNQWIFGHGLQLVSCEGLDDQKLEQTVVGHNVFTGAGKRIDALLKTKGVVSRFLFGEIKTHLAALLDTQEYRPEVFVPGKDLRGAVAQVQKTIHKVVMLSTRVDFRETDVHGNPTGEEVALVAPKGVVVIGKLSEFATTNGINYNRFVAFELYRQQCHGVDIVTYDELYERAKAIVEDVDPAEPNSGDIY